jgi:hypothetical protein
MEPEGSLPYSQVPATCPYPQPTPSSPHNPLQLPEDPSYIIFPSTSGSPQRPLFPQVSSPIPRAHLSPIPYVPHSQPISFFSILPLAQYWVRNTDHAIYVISISILHPTDAYVFKLIHSVQLLQPTFCINFHFSQTFYTTIHSHPPVFHDTKHIWRQAQIN